MKRFLIFTALYPPLVLLGLIATVSEIQRNLDIGELLWMLGIAYLVGLFSRSFARHLERRDDPLDVVIESGRIMRGSSCASS
jgi:hypothetical protein